MSNFALPKIVIASVLKPVDDSRMTEKIGLSLQSTGNYKVCCIGQPSRSQVLESLTAYPIGPFPRLSFSRIFAPWKIFKIASRVKPSLFIFTTHELLLVGVLLKLLTRCKIVYDVQENYYRNILYTDAFPMALRPLVAHYVRLKEMITLPLVDHYFLAEAGYEQELKFIRRHKTIIENKVRLTSLVPKGNLKSTRNRLLFTGTLAESTGVFLAIELAIKLHNVNPSIRLKIVGYAAKQSTLDSIQRRIANLPFVELQGGDVLIPHEVILNAILQADVGIICYPLNPSTESSTPTKLYEYLGCQLPILLIDHAPWVNLCQPYNAAVIFNPESINPDAIVEMLAKQNFYSTPPTNVSWESEEIKLISVVDKLLDARR